MPETMKPSTYPSARYVQGQIYGESGIGPEDVEPEDVLCVLQGCAVPVVLRQVQDEYTILGEAYVSLLMHGEAVLAAKEEDFEGFCLR